MDLQQNFYFPSMAAHSSKPKMRTPKTIGSTWLAQYKKKWWPVVLCRNEIAPKAFMESRSSPYSLPAILLGKHIFIWVNDIDLQPFNPLRDYLEGRPKPENEEILATDGRDLRTEKQRRHAFLRDVLHFNDDKYWANYINGESAVRKIERGWVNRRKRPTESDDDIEVVGIKNSGTCPPKAKKQQRVQNGGGIGGSYLPTPKTTPGQTRTIDESDDDDLFVGQSRNLSDPFTGSNEGIDNDETTRLREIQEKTRRHIQDKPPRCKECIIFVGPEHTPFRLKTDLLAKCDFLKNLRQCDESDNLFINLAEEGIDMAAEDFKPVLQYLSSRQFLPRLVDGGGGNGQQLQGINLQEDMDEAAKRIAMVYITASKLRFEALQRMCVKKLKVLYPLSPSLLLLMVTIIERAEKWECKAEGEMADWLVHQLAQQFLVLMTREPMTFGRLLTEHHVLRERVFERLPEHKNARIEGEGMV